MNLRLPTVALFIILVISCNTRVEKSKQTPDSIPEALAEDHKSDISLYKSRSYNILEDLYQEQVAKNAKLKSIKEGLNKLPELKADSMEVFEKFNDKNKDYYRLANDLAGIISDSVLKSRMLALIASSQSNYDNHIKTLSGLSASINNNDKMISDYHTILKLKITMPLMESFQKSSRPSDNGMNHIVKQQEALLKKINASTPN